MDFGSASYGVDVQKIVTYVGDLQTEILVKVGDTIRNIDDISNAVKAGWVGQSADQFLLNLDKAATMMCETLKGLNDTFQTEIYGIKDQMMEFDDTLVEAE